MKKPWLVVYSSMTGNTKKVAEAIFAVLPEGSEIHPVETAPDSANYEKIAVGYWAYRGTADKTAQPYMSGIKNAQVFVFATLGAYPDSEHAKKVLDNGQALLGENCEVLGRFICQGKLSPGIIERGMKRPVDHPHGPTPERLKRWQDASTHPDENDCHAVQAMIKGLI